MLNHASVLILSIYCENFEVIFDVSLLKIGTIRLKKGKPTLLHKCWQIVFESCKFILAERNYTTCEEKIIVVVHALQTWYCYLEGSECRSITNHNPLTSLKSQHKLSTRHARWLEYLEQTFHCQREHRLRKSNVANSLCRNPLDEKWVKLALLARTLNHVASNHWRPTMGGMLPWK